MPDVLVSDLSTATPTSSSTVLGETGGVVKRFAVDDIAPQPSAKRAGSFSTPAERTAALTAALAASDVVFVNSGIYDPIEITASNKTLVMDAGVEFKLPNATIGASDVTGTAVFKVSGSNVTVEGDFTVNGNKANNSSNSFPTSVRIGSCYVTGSNVKFNGEVHVQNAYWVGFSAEGGSTAGTEISGLYVHRLKISDADYQSVMLWSVTKWRIDEIAATGGSVGSWIYGTKDQRVRLGTQLSNTSKCKNGSVGSIYSDANVTLTLENGIENVTVDVALTGAGGKIQNASRITIGTWLAWDASLKNQAYGLAVIDSDIVDIGAAIVKGYDCDPAFAGHAFVIDGGTDLTIGSIAVSGSLATSAGGSWDMVITSADNVHIGQVSLVDPVGTLNGFLFDYDAAYAPQQDITIDSLVSRGHSTYDVVVENKGAIRIGALNSDAVEQYPNNRNNMAVSRQSTWTPTISRTGSNVTYTTQEGHFAVLGQMVVANFNIVVASIVAQGADYWVISLPIAAKSSYMQQSGCLALRAAVSGALGVYVLSGGSTAYLVNATGTDAFNSALGTGTISGTLVYMID